MSEAVRLLGAAVVPVIVALAATPVAIRVAGRLRFEDSPVGYKGHAHPTPYLGGAAVLAAFLAGAIPFGEALVDFLPVTACALGLWAVGTLDDRRTVTPLRRVAAEAAAAVVLWATGLGWALFELEILNLLVTVLWVVGLVNAFNLMDNMDGAAGTVAAASAAGIAGIALVAGDAILAALAIAMGAACLAFLRYNLASPARIFLGDGGSMPLGLVAAAAIMALPLEQRVGGWPALLLGMMLVGLPLLDTALVSLSRYRRRVPLWRGARDHLTHRLRESLPSARAVSAALLLAQAALCGLALVALGLGRVSVIGAAVLSLVLGVVTVLVLEFSATPAPVRQKWSG